jgi:DMSO/TMAO reductase YedYZ molybdopterin-dependent catalytic subunit
MLFHYYYTVTNIPPNEFKPVQVHLWASILAVPLLAAHLGSHLIETGSGLARERRELRAQVDPPADAARRVMTRQAFMATVVAGGLGLAFAFQNTPLVNREFKGLFIGRIPPEERNGPGDFPVETLFGKREVDVSQWSLRIEGDVGQPVTMTYDELLALPAVTKQIRLSCVSGWTVQPVWSGPRVRDVLALAGANDAARAVNFHSVSDYAFTWHRHRLAGDSAILATHVYGAPLSNNHGFPVRLIVPGYPGQNMVKQIDRITVQRDKERINPDFHLTSADVRDNACARQAESEA